MKIIADTGVIVAYLDKRDKWHDWTFEQMRILPAPYSVCESVITESCFLLDHLHNGKNNVLAMLKAGFLTVDFSLSDEVKAVQTLIKKYDNVPISLADACLVRMSELIDNSTVFTLDSDFHIYRKNGKRKIALIIPE
jgi:predicted nucleic acid-binding protein